MPTSPTVSDLRATDLPDCDVCQITSLMSNIERSMFVLHEVLNDLICDVDRLGFYHFYNKYKISDKTYRSSKELERARPVPDMNLIITGDSKSDIFHSIENNIGYLGLTRDGPLIPQADTRYRCQSSHVFIGQFSGFKKIH